MTLRSRFEHLVHAFDLRVTGKWILLSSAIGIVAGMGAIAFQVATQFVLYFALGKVAGYSPAETLGEHSVFPHLIGEFSPFWLLVVITAGGLVSGFLVYTFAPEAEGHGTDAAIDSFHNKGGRVRNRVPIVKTIASAVTIGTGGSGGREGPIAQIGAGFGSFLATKLKLSSRDRRIMLAAGMGAGVGAIFRAPLAGALFAGEILYSDADLESDVIVPAAMSSIVGYTVFGMWLPPEKRFMPLFGGGMHYSIDSFLELIPLTALAIVLVLAGIFYIKTFYGTHAVFKKLPILPHVRPALGALLAGLTGVGLFYSMDRNPQVLSVLSTGYGSLQSALSPNERLATSVLLAIALVKVVTTSLTIGSGGSGGVFGPSMVIGGCLGTAVGQTFHSLWPGLVAEPRVYGIVGMAGFFAGCAHAPFSTIIMVSEMTGDYGLLLPSMWVCTLCFLLGQHWKLYQNQVPSRLESPAHRGDFIVDVLEGIKVEEVYQKGRKLTLIPEGMSLDEIVHLLATTTQHYFPVVDGEERMVGIFSSDDVRSYLYNETIWQLAVARDIMIGKFLSVTPEDDLNTAMRRFTQLNLDELPVLDATDSGRLLGMLRRKETISFYNRLLAEHKQAALAE